jgi:hypothetical protein
MIRKSGMAFADSSYVIDKALETGLERGLTFRTLSPALLMSDRDNIESAESSWEDTGAEELARDSLVFCQSMYDALKEEEHLAKFAISIAQSGITFPTMVRVAMSVREEDFTSPVTVLRSRSGDTVADKVQNIPWEEVLKNNASLEIVDIDTSAIVDTERHRPESIGFIDRQRLGGWEKIGFQLIQRFWSKMPFGSPRGTFLLLRENPLLRETALHLAYRGYALKTLEKPAIEDVKEASSLVEEIVSKIDPALEAFLSPRLPEKGIARLKEIFRDLVITAVQRFHAGEEYWTKTLKKPETAKAKAILTNMLMTPETAALHHVCKIKDLPVISFQHGVAREVNRYNTYIQAYFEGNTADRFYTFNPAAAKISEENPFNESRNIPVGFPALYQRTGSYRGRQNEAAPILYASTQLFIAAFNMAATRGCSDTEMARSEMRLVDNVFATLPHRILYKPYPERRFLDPDPVLEKAKDVANIEIYDKGDDLRYLMANSRVVVTGRATSTLGWCVASKKPLVFIDYPRQLPLRENAKKAMDKAFFVFNAEESDYLSKLARFLSKSVEEIEDLWQQMAPTRNEVVQEYFGCGGWGAGRRAASDIVATLSQYR